MLDPMRFGSLGIPYLLREDSRCGPTAGELVRSTLNKNCRSTMSRRQVTLLLPAECLRHIIWDLGRLFPLDARQCCPKRLCFETDLKHLPAFVALLKMATFRQVHV